MGMASDPVPPDPTEAIMRDFLSRLFRMEGYTYANVQAAVDAYLPDLVRAVERCSE